ncbi:MAG: CDP-alcohol phosphatidyltransferase family protein [Candidatus Thorarchaeota archaeon]|nr:CDP-alcohol phosphatidyltransferase family protein [Candidatus Thorarchaeota archaeon]MCK5389445.1 CDP-alcohol phosphatidyltransferase family protein [Candidatus Thorarchaeota archaeon]
MPSRFRVRGLFRGLVLLIARPFARAGISPDSITYVSLLFALFAFISLPLTQLQVLFATLVFITGLLDGVDGAVARMNDSATKAGGLTDSVIDKVAETLILAGIALAYTNTTLLGLSVSMWALLAVFGWLMTSYTRARAESLGVSDLDIGLGGRSERLLTLVIFSLAGFVIYGLVVVTIMALCTAAYRLFHYKRQIIDNT